MERKILLVDDEKNVVRALKRELMDWAISEDITFLSAESGDEALEILEKNHDSIILIISDLRMPIMKGSDLLLKVNELYPEIMSILLTGFSEPREIMKAIKAGIFSYILKPWDAEYLATEIKKAIQVHDLKRENELYQKRVREDLMMAGELQRRLFSVKIHRSEKVQFDVTYKPLSDFFCGGDYYDIISLDKNRYLVLIGDVVGHGVKAAFITAVLKAMIYHEYVMDRKKGHFSPADFLSWLNGRICEDFSHFPDILITFAAGVLDLDKDSFIFSNAGHNPVYILRDGKVLKSGIDGPALGFLEQARYNDMKLSLQRNDRLLLFTDGIIEVSNSRTLEDKVWGKILLDPVEGPEKQETFSRTIIKRVKNVAEINDFSDDVTLISIFLP
ncbi:MAG: fused response regulator/phosphatase [Spirochaetales bacterium]|nr:fused response regulator/phosphatase [Spirochaetales bacterium]